MTTAEDVLAHHGVKGMHWGKRKGDSTGAESPTDVVLKTRAGKLVKGSGGKNHPASEDALRVAVTRQKARKSTTDALSTKDLQELVNRMNLEQQYTTLAAKDLHNASDVKLFIDKTLAAGQTANKIHALANSPAGKAAKIVIKAKLGK